MKAAGKSQPTRTTSVRASRPKPSRVQESTAGTRCETDVLEFVQNHGACKVDRQAGVIYDVKLVGPRSRNGGRYTRTCMEGAIALYDGARCNIDHPDKARPGADRPLSARFGVFRDPYIAQDGSLYAKRLEFIKSHPLAESICEAAEKPGTFGIGFSHNVKTIQATDPQTGETIHESITRVRSVDLVADPATTTSMLESEDSMNDPHVDGAELLPEAPAQGETAVEASAFDKAMDEFAEQALAGKLDKAGFVAKARKLYELFIDDKPSEDEGGDDSDAGGGGGSAGDGTAEGQESARETGKAAKSNAATPAPDAWKQAMDVLESESVPVTTIRVQALMAMPDDASRKALAQSWKGMAVGASTKAKPRSGSTLESQRHEAAQPQVKPITAESAKDFAARLMTGR